MPIFVARAGQDKRTLKTTDRFICQALTANVALDFANHPQGQHGFDVLDDDARSQQIIARTIAFKANTG